MMVCLYSKVISVHKTQRTGGQQVGENLTDGGTMLMKRAGKKAEGRRARQRRRDGRMESRGRKEGEELFISMTL